MSAAVVRWQIVTPHAESSANFYKKLFGWTVTQDNAPDAPSFVQLFVEVSDVDATIATAEKLGATVIVLKAVLPDGDVMAVLRDPTGITFGLCTTAQRSPSR